MKNHYPQIFRAFPLPGLLLLPNAPQFTIAGVNVAYLKITGKNETDLLGKGIFEIFPGNPGDTTADVILNLRQSLLMVISTGKADKMTMLQGDIHRGDVANSDGKYFDYENIPIHDDEGNVTTIIHTASDVTEKFLLQKKQEALQEKSNGLSTGAHVTLSASQDIDINRETNQAALINSTDDLIWSVDRDCKLIAANNAFMESLESFTGKRFKPGDDLLMKEVFAEDHLAFWSECYNQALSGNSFKKEIYTPALNKGKELWSETIFNPVWQGDMVMGIACYSRDVTERKFAEEENRFKAELLNTIGQAVIATGLDGTINFWNNAAEEIYGWTAGEATGKNVVDLIPAQQTTQQAGEIMKELLLGKSWSGDFLVQRKNGQVFPIFVTDSPVFDQDNKLSGVIGVSNDITERKKTADQLLFDEQQLAVIYNTVTDIIFLLSVEKNERFKFISVNHSFLKATGLTSAQVIGQYADCIIPDASWKIVAGNYQKAIQTGKTVEWEEISEYPTGIKIGLVCVTPVLDNKGKCARLVGSIHDVTESKKAEAEIKNSEERYRTLFEQNVAGFYQTTMEGVILNCNDAFVKMLKYNSREDLLKRNASELYFSSEDRNNFIANVVNKKKLYSNEGVLKCKDGSALYFLENISLRKDVITGEEFCDGIIIDITKRKLAEDTLMSTSSELQHALTEQILSRKKTEDSEKRFRQIVETAQEGIWLIDEHDYTTFINKKMCEIIGYDEEELTGKKIYHFMDDESRKNSLAQIERRKLGMSEIHDSVFVTKSGRSVWVNISTNPVLDENGKYKGALAMITDITERKQSEIRLVESNERFINVTKATFDAIWDWDLLHETIYWGEGFENMFGYDVQAAKQNISSWTDHIHPEDIERVLKGVYEFIAGSEINWKDEYRYLRKNQTYATVTDKGFVIRDELGKATRMVGAMQDISDKKELEDLLKKVNNLARIGSWEVDFLKSTVYWSQTTHEIHETGHDFIPDMENVINFFKESESRELISQKVQDAIEKGIPYDLELEIITGRGNEKWIRLVGEAEFSNGKCVRIYGSFQDIDARKRAELAVIKAFDEKNTILESIGDAFFTVDKNWKVSYWNNQAEKMLGIPRNEIIGHHLWEIFASNIGSESYVKYHEAIETGQVVHFEDYYPPLKRWYAVSGYPSDNGLSVYFKDVTDRKLAEIRSNKLNESLQIQAKELAVSNAELEQFAYVASHDLQEPLRMVTSFLSQLEKKYGHVIDDKGKEYIGFAVDGARRMRQIILDLLEFSRVGRIEDKIEPVNLNALIEEVQILFRKQVEEKSASIQFAKLPLIHSYKAPLRQVFQNLISNALKYSRTGVPPQIRITARKLINHWQFSVADNGIGIDEEYFDKIFIIFQRLHNRSDFSGTGLGLAITKKIIENMGGKIWLESKKGKGSTFYFTLLK